MNFFHGWGFQENPKSQILFSLLLNYTLSTAQALGYPTSTQDLEGPLQAVMEPTISWSLGFSERSQHTLLYQSNKHRACSNALMR